MDRRAVLKGIGALAAGAGSLAAPAIAQGIRVLKMVTSWPRNLPGSGTVAQRLADSITTLSDGKLRVELFAAGELVPALEVFDAVSTGTADLYHSADYYFSGKHRAYAFFTGVPFGMTATEHSAWIHHGGGQELWDELSAGFEVKPLLCGNTGVQAAGWFRKPLADIESVRGLTMRTPGLAGEVWRRIGANAVTVPAGEIFMALESGAIDAAEWIGPWSDFALGLHKVTKHYYVPSPLEPSAAVCLGINAGLWTGLSDWQRGVLRAAAALTHHEAVAEVTHFNALSLAELVSEHGITVASLPPDIVAEMARATPDVIAGASEDDLGRRVRRSYETARDNTAPWSFRAEAAYVAARGASRT